MVGQLVRHLESEFVHVIWTCYSSKNLCHEQGLLLSSYNRMKFSINRFKAAEGLVLIKLPSFIIILISCIFSPLMKSSQYLYQTHAHTHWTALSVKMMHLCIVLLQWVLYRHYIQVQLPNHRECWWWWHKLMTGQLMCHNGFLPLCVCMEMCVHVQNRSLPSHKELTSGELKAITVCRMFMWVLYIKWNERKNEKKYWM